MTKRGLKQIVKHIAALQELINPFLATHNPKDDAALSEAFYAFEEMGLLGNLRLHRNIDMAVSIWSIVEAVRKNGFPERLRM